MKYNVYTVWDTVAEECGPLFTAKNDRVAQRQFKNMVIKERIVDIDEYHLLCVGNFDSNGQMLVAEKARLIDIYINMNIPKSVTDEMEQSESIS